MARPKVFRHSALNGKKSLEDFARGIEDKLRKSGDRETITNRFCGLLISNNGRVAALMLCKWVEWAIRQGQRTRAKWSWLRTYAHQHHQPRAAARRSD